MVTLWKVHTFSVNNRHIKSIANTVSRGSLDYIAVCTSRPPCTVPVKTSVQVGQSSRRVVCCKNRGRKMFYPIKAMSRHVFLVWEAVFTGRGMSRYKFIGLILYIRQMLLLILLLLKQLPVKHIG